MSEVIKTTVVPERTHTEVVHKCDICGREGELMGDTCYYESFRYIGKCHMCGAEVCAGCSIYVGKYSHGDNWHRWERVYCNACWELGIEQRKRISEATNKFDDIVKLEMKRWKVKCMF